MSGSERLYRLQAHEARELIRNRALRPSELVADVCRRAEESEPRIRAYRALLLERAMDTARELDTAQEKKAALGPLAGIPVAVKDNICTAGVPTTCGSRLLEDYVPPYNATAVERLLSAGAVLMGKTNLDEFAMGSSTEHSAFGSTLNPWDPSRVPGGSSGGSAAAVSAGSALAALGSDTGGSVRLPAAYCGVIGLRPTYGRVSRYGLAAFASSLDQIGPLARSARDCALILDVIGGRDPRDATSQEGGGESLLRVVERGVEDLRVGVPRELLAESAPEVRSLFDAALKSLADLGADIRDIRMPHAPYGLPVYHLIANAEASANLARYDGIRYGARQTAPDGGAEETIRRTRSEGFGAEVKRRIMLGTFVLSSGYYEAFYLKAQEVRTRIRRDFELAFAEVDVICSPTAPTPAFPLGERLASPLDMYRTDVYTIPGNLAGLPSVSAPCGLAGGRWPVGLQFSAPAGAEGRLLRLTRAYEEATGFVNMSPPGGMEDPAQ